MLVRGLHVEDGHCDCYSIGSGVIGETTLGKNVIIVFISCEVSSCSVITSSFFLACTTREYVDISLHGGRFWARSTASFSVRL